MFLCKELICEIGRNLDNARSDYDFVHSDQYCTPEEYAEKWQRVYGMQHIGDGYGTRGSSAVPSRPGR